jgi:hypothetical protein
MALHRSKRTDEARELLEAAIGQLELARQGHAGAPASLYIDAWQRRELDLLRAEAESLIKPRR